METNHTLHNAAVALKYRQAQQDAPQVVAKGRGAIAQKILEIARKNKITVLQDAELANLLMSVEPEEYIPQEAFSVVAEIYAFLIDLDKEYEKVLD
jgi:flagellar biosynthesis protein